MICVNSTLELSVTPEARQPGFIVETWGPGLSPRGGPFPAVLDQALQPSPGAVGVDVINFRDAGGGGEFEPSVPYPGLPGEADANGDGIGDVNNEDFIFRAQGFLLFNNTDTVTLSVLRNGQKIQLTATLGQRAR